MLCYWHFVLSVIFCCCEGILFIDIPSDIFLCCYINTPIVDLFRPLTYLISIIIWMDLLCAFLNLTASCPGLQQVLGTACPHMPGYTQQHILTHTLRHTPH